MFSILLGLFAAGGMAEGMAVGMGAGIAAGMGAEADILALSHIIFIRSA
jgi:hypothetical protein